MKRNTYALVSALLGVFIGVMACLICVRLAGPSKKFDGDYNRWRKLNLILEQVEENYVDTIDQKAMTDAAVMAALGKLDPHSVYLPPVELKESETELAGNFDGIGIQFNVPNDTAIVLSVIPGGPSEKAGLLQGDRIIRVDDKVIAGMKTPQDSMVRLMKGPSGSKVKIVVNRDGEQIPFDITRGKIPVHCVDAAFMIDAETLVNENRKLNVLESSLPVGVQIGTRAVQSLHVDDLVALFKEFIAEHIGLVQIASGVVPKVEDQPRHPFADQFGAGLGDFDECRSGELRELDVACGVIDHERRVHAVYRDFSSCDLERDPLFASSYGDGDLSACRAFHPAHHAVLRKSHAGDVLFPDLENPVAFLKTDLLGWPSRNDLQHEVHDGSVVRHVELYADAVEIAGEVSLRLCQLHRRHVDRVRVKLRKCSRDCRFSDIIDVDGVHIVSVDLVEDQIQLAPVTVLYPDQVLFLGI